MHLLTKHFKKVEVDVIYNSRVAHEDMLCFNWRAPEIALKVTLDRQEVIQFCLMAGTMFFLLHRHCTHNFNIQHPEAFPVLLLGGGRCFVMSLTPVGEIL